MIKAVRGTRDLLPPDTDLWNRVDAKVRELFARYNYHEIRTPIFEDTQLFSRSVGEDTDIVSKEMFTWENGRPLALVLDRLWREGYEADGKQQQGFGQRYENLTPHEPEVGDFDYEGVREGVQHIILIRAQADSNAVQLIGQHRRELEIPGLAKPRFVLAVPASEEKRARSILPLDVELQLIQIPPWLRRPESLTLRPENTAGVVRAYIEHGFDKKGTLQKLYYIGPQFRRERPQKGRYRQFFQIGAEIIGPPSAGSESPLRDAELLEMLATLLDEVGLRSWQLQLNSVGCADDRARYNKALREALQPVVHQMCADCQRRAETNPLRVLDCKVPEDQPIIEKLPRILQYLDEPCREHFAAVRAMLDAVGIAYTINERMVRGLDYYTRTTFEFTHGGLGAQSAVLGGGRYDGLSESLEGPKAPGIGFAIGEDRLILALQSQGEAAVEKLQAYVAPLGAGMNVHALKLARELRRDGISADLGDESFRLKKSFELAEKAGAGFIVIVGENEVTAGQFAVKNLESGQQVQVPRAELAAHLRHTQQ